MAFFAKLCCSSNRLPPFQHAIIDSKDHLDEKTAIDSTSTPNLPSIQANDSTNTSKVHPTHMVVDTVKVALSLLHVTLDSVPVPGLKGLIGGVLFIMDTFDRADRAHEVFADLEHNIVNLETLLSKYRDPAQEMPEDIKSLIATLNDDLEEASAQIQQVVNRNLMRKIVTGSTDAILVTRLIKRVDWAVAKMMAGISLNSANSVQRLEESGRKAFLDKIVRAKGASWKHLDHPVCLPGTRVSLLEEIVNWFRSNDSCQVFWLNGLAGTGKTTVARTVAELAAAQGILGASFFCSRDSSERSDHNLVFPTIAFQLAEGDARLAAKISDAVRDNLDISSMRPEEQLKTLILQPLKEQGSTRIPLLAVVDALDECRDPAAAEKILLALSRHGAFSLPFFKVFVTSRPIPSARAAFKDDSLSSLSLVVVLHEMDSHDVDEDIRLFINDRLQEGARQPDRFDVPPDWPPTSLVDKLVRKSSSLFIFASTACQYITASGGDLEERLDEITNLPTSEYERHLGIDALYKRVFDVAFERFPDAKTIMRCRSIVGTVILLQNPVGIADLAIMLDLKVPVVRSILSELRSLLIVPDDPDGDVRPFHLSLHDFLTDRERCPENLYIDPPLQHRQIAIGLLQCMNRMLKRNMCQIDRFTLNQDVEDLEERVAKHINRGLICACQHWAHHLSSLPADDDTAELVDLLSMFAHEKMLNWIEALSLLGTLPSAISALEDVATWCLSGGLRMRELANLFRDGQRTVQHFAHGIKQCASQIYNAIPFIPTQTILRDVYMREDDESIKVLSGMEKEWNTCLRTIQSGDVVLFVSFSPDNTRVAASGKQQSLGIVKLWDARTGELVAQSDPHGDDRPAFAFLPNGWLVIGSTDGSLRVWDVDASKFAHPLRRHANDILCISVSAAGGHFASASEDAVYIWNTSTWESEELEGAHKLVSISCRGIIAALIHPSEDDTIIGIWDLHSRELKGRIIGHTDTVQTLEFSPDGRRLVSGGADGSVRIWDVETGEQRIELGGLPGWVLSVAFSPNGMHVAGCDNAVRVWDASTGKQQSILKGHQAQINDLTFSPNGMFLATGSLDNMVKIWDWHGALMEGEEDGHSEWIQTVAISPDGRIFVTGSWDTTIAMWDSSNGRLIRLWKGHDRPVLSVVFSPDGRIFATAGGEMVVKFWNSVTGELERTLHCHPDHDDSSESGDSTYPDAGTGALAFSVDGAQLALETESNMTIWDVKTGEDRAIWAGSDSDHKIYSLTFSPDGHRLATGHEDYIYEIDLDKPAESDDRFIYLTVDGVHRQIAYDDEGSCIISSAGVAELPNTPEPRKELPKCLKALHLSQGWLIDSEGNRRCWVPEAYQGSDVHASHGLTRVVLGGTNGRPLIVDLTESQVQS